MAKAKVTKRIDEITLSLSKREAEAILALVGAVTGSMNSARTHTREVYNALSTIGLENEYYGHLNQGPDFRSFKDDER